MSQKTLYYAQLAEDTARRLTGNWERWAGFLSTAARLYKYPYPDQLMIYAQRPDATACASYDVWNDRMNRYVRRGSKGIALLDDAGDRLRLRYVFDLADTGTRQNSRDPWLWTLEDRHRIPVAAMLERRYGTAATDLPQQLDSEILDTVFNKVVPVSAKTQTGLADLEAAVSEVLGTADFDTAAPTLMNERQNACCRSALEHLNEAHDALTVGVTRDAVQVCMDAAIEELDTLTGKRATESVVDAVFAQFCVGK